MSLVDYECCAVCDKRLAYYPGVDPKTTLCPRCIFELAEFGVFIYNMDQFREWIQTADPQALREILTRLNYRPCPRENGLDDIILDRAFSEIARVEQVEGPTDPKGVSDMVTQDVIQLNDKVHKVAGRDLANRFVNLVCGLTILEEHAKPPGETASQCRFCFGRRT